jgi:hypothetical protein
MQYTVYDIMRARIRYRVTSKVLVCVDICIYIYVFLTMKQSWKAFSPS